MAIKKTFGRINFISRLFQLAFPTVTHDRVAANTNNNSRENRNTVVFFLLVAYGNKIILTHSRIISTVEQKD